MTKQHQEFNYYCLDRLKSCDNIIPVTYDDGGNIKKLSYKIGLRSNIKHEDCFILYTESDRDLDQFIYITSEDFYNAQKRFYTDVFKKFELSELFKKLRTINIFEFASLLNFVNIHEEFQNFIEINWNTLNMDELVEL